MTDRLAIGMLLLATALMLSALALSPAPFLHDYAEWVYQAKILALKVSSPAEVQGFVLYAYPVPYMLMQYSLAGLHLVFSPFLAAKLFIVAYFVLAGLVCRAFVSRFVASRDRRVVAWTLLVCIAGFSSFFWYGFIGYQLGLLVFVGFLARYGSSSSPWMVAAYATLAFFAHATIFMQLGLLVGLAVVFCRFPRTQLLGLAPAVLLSLWFLAGRQLSGTVMPASDAEFAGVLEAIIYKIGMLTMQGPFKNFLLADGSALLENAPLVYWSGVVANVLVVSTLGLLIAAAAVRTVREGIARKEQSDRLLLLFLLCAAVAYALSPFNFFGIVHPGSRMILPALFAGLALLFRQAFLFHRALAVVVVAGTLCTVLAYLLTAASVTTLAEAAAGARGEGRFQGTRSVLAANADRYPETRYSYYNYRVFAFSHRYLQLEQERYRGMAFPTGPIARYDMRLAQGAD